MTELDTEPLFEKVSSSGRLFEVVAEQVESVILEGGLAPGTKLPPERVMADQFGVSRTVIREAMKSLEREGLVEVQHGKGVVVSAKTAGSVADSLERYIAGRPNPILSLLELRRIVEIEAAGLAAERRDEDDVLELNRLVAEMRAAVDEPARYVELDVELHRALFRATKNPLIEIVLEPFVRLLRESRRLGSTVTRAPHRSISVHESLVAAVAAGDPVAAREQMAEHFRQVERFIVESSPAASK